MRTRMLWMAAMALGLAILASVLIPSNNSRVVSAPNDLCTSHLGQLILDGKFCTHGDDRQFLPTADASPSPSPRCLVKVRGQGLICGLRLLPTASPTPGPSPSPLPSPQPGCGGGSWRIQALYLRESTQPDRFSELQASIAGAMSDANSIVLASAQRENRTARLRYRTDEQCAVLVGQVVTDRPQENFASAIAAAQDAGYTREDYIYLIFSDNRNGCGIATVIGDSQPDPEANRNNNSVHYSNVSLDCMNGPTVAHELAHNMGAVQNDAPHSTGAWHCNDEYDNLCYNDGGPTSEQRYVCDQPSLWDCRRDDYFAFEPQSEYLRTHWNLTRSRWIDVG